PGTVGHCADGGAAPPRRGLARQRPLERLERPGGGAVSGAVGPPLQFGEDALPLGSSILGFAPAPAGTVQGGQSLLVAALHQLADAVPALIPRLASRLRVGLSSPHGEQRPRPFDDIDPFAAGCGGALPGLRFVWGPWPY